jgi:hypothetical protein
MPEYLRLLTLNIAPNNVGLTIESDSCTLYEPYDAINSSLYFFVPLIQE